MNVIRVRASYAPTAKFTTWLYTLAHHRMIDHWRANAQVKLASIDAEGTVRAAVEALPGSKHDEPEARCATEELGARLRAALLILPAPRTTRRIPVAAGGRALTRRDRGADRNGR